MIAENNLLRDTLQRLISSDEFLSINIVGVYVYGSFITNELTEKSDIDCFIIVEDISSELITKIKSLKVAVEDILGREFFINMSAKDDFSMESFARGFFTHRERPYYFLFELKYNFKLFYGRNFVSEIKFPEMMESRVKEECIRLIKNLQYINNKLLVNSETNLYSKDAAFKNILFAVKIFQIFYEYRFTSYQESAALASRILNSRVPLMAYDYVKKPGESLDFEVINSDDSVAFYNLVFKFMAGAILPDKKVNGCVQLGDCLGYFSAKKEVISGEAPAEIVIFLNGLPRPAQTQEVSDYFVKNGYLFINLYYPGYWEASGKMNFSKLGLEIIAFAKALKTGKIFDVFAGKDFIFKAGRIFLIGSSFGASVSLAAQDDIFSKIVAISPLIDFAKHKETIDNLLDKLVFFKEVVRLSNEGRAREDFFTLDQKYQELRISPERILLIADRLDKQVNFTNVKEYADRNKMDIWSTDSGAHGYKIIKQDNIFEKLFKFIKK